MDKKSARNLQTQGTSDTPGFGASGVVVPDPAVSSSCDGPRKRSLVEKSLDNKSTNKVFLRNLISTRIFEDTRTALSSLEEISLQASRRTQGVIEIISERTRELYLMAVRMELARDYLLDRIEHQGNRIRELDAEIKALRIFASGRESPTLRMSDVSWEIFKNIQDPLDFSEREASASRLSLSIVRSPSLVRGDRAESDGGISALSILEGTIATVASGLRMEEVYTDEILATEITQRENAVAFVMKEIIMKTATMVDVEKTHTRKLDETEHIIDDLGESMDNDQWAGRAHRRSEANRPRGRSPRITNQIYMNMNMDNDKESLLLPQRLRSLSDRRTSPTVPGAGTSLSYEGPTPRLSMGEEDDRITVDEMNDGDKDEDPLLLPSTFIECPSGTNAMEDEAQLKALQTPRAKRKARLSPGVQACSEGEQEPDSAEKDINKVTLRKRKDKKKARVGLDTSFELTDEVISIDSEVDSDKSAREKDRLKKKREKDKRKSSGKKATPKGKKERLIVSSEEEDNLGEFAPDELRRMDVTTVGALGIDYLKDVERMRSKSRNIQGGISGKMRNNLQKATDVINTLIYKVASTGDPAKLKIDNRALMEEIEKLKLQEILRKKEMDEMRIMMNALKKELEECKDKVDEMEVDRNKARNSQRIAEWKMRRAIAAAEGKEFIEKVPVRIEEEGDLTRKETIDGRNTKENDMRMNANKDMHADDIEVFSDVRSDDTWSKDRKDKGNEQDKKSEELKDIQRQIKELVKRKAEVKKKDRNDSGSNSFKARDEKPLPQRTPRTRLRVVSNVQLAPPRPTDYSERKFRESDRDMTEDSNKEGSIGLIGSEDNRNWKRTDARKRREEEIPGRKGREYRDYQTPRKRVYSGNKDSGMERQNNTQRAAPIRKPRRTAAVMIVGKDKDFSYADALKEARNKISLDDLRIENSRVRKAANGGLIVEVIGPDGSGKANALAEQLQVILQDRARVTRPVTKGEIRLVGLDESVSTEDVRLAIAKYGECNEADIRIGSIRPMNNGLFTVWAKCPLSAAITMANEKKIRLGWTFVRVDLLEPRPTQCYKCWRYGHLKNSCTSQFDHSGCCFNCGGSNHRVGQCKLPAKCMVCADDKKDANHRLGSAQCATEVRTKQGTRIFYRTPVKTSSGTLPTRQTDPERGAGSMDVVQNDPN